MFDHPDLHIHREGSVTVYESPRGMMRRSTPVGHVVLAKIIGRLDMPLAEAIMHNGNATVQRGYQTMSFNDWTEMESYDARARQRLTEWSRRLRRAGQIKSAALLVPAGVVAMGASVASMLLGSMSPLRVFTDPEQFERLLERECASVPVRWRRDGTDD